MPANIVAFTFTDKAAAELKERIHERCREAFGAMIGLAEMYVGTIHGFCLELLKSEVPEYMKYEVLNEVQQALFVDRHSRGVGPHPVLHSRRQAAEAVHGHPQLRRGALHPARGRGRADASKLAECSVAECLALYEHLLHDKGYLDYSGILKEAVAALRRNDDGLRERLARAHPARDRRRVPGRQSGAGGRGRDAARAGRRHLRGRRRRPDASTSGAAATSTTS